MELSTGARGDYEACFGRAPFDLVRCDPEFSALFSRFAFEEAAEESKLDPKTRYLAILAALMGCQGIEAFRAMAPAALRAGVTAVEFKELVYQGAAYLGLGRTLPFLQQANQLLEEQGVPLPLPPQGTTTPATRIQAGNEAQVEIFGAQMRGFQNSGPAESRHINRWLAGNCFGDYYTRGGLDCRQREMITFCFLAAQGGCEPQLVSHAAGNLRIGNHKAFLIDVLSQCLPYIGYPRSLNALRSLNEAAAQADDNRRDPDETA